MKRFYYDSQLQFYMNAFMYVDTETMEEEDNFQKRKKLLQTTRKCQLWDLYLKIGLYLITFV